MKTVTIPPLKTITITIKGQQSHINKYNRTEYFGDMHKARIYLSEWLNKLNFDGETPWPLENGQFFDCRDYIVYIEIA